MILHICVAFVAKSVTIVKKTLNHLFYIWVLLNMKVKYVLNNSCPFSEI